MRGLDGTLALFPNQQQNRVMQCFPVIRVGQSSLFILGGKKLVPFLHTMSSPKHGSHSVIPFFKVEFSI